MTEVLFNKKLIPVAVIENADTAIPLAQALIEAGLNVIEVTLRTDAALESIERIKQSVPEMQIGAGTILDHKLIPQLIDLGISFGIAPGINTRVIETALKHNLPIMPGVVTPSDIEQARFYDLKLLKFFPAEAVGGVKVLKALAGPYAHTGLKFIPTGGINRDNLSSYLSLNTVAAVGGSWFVSGALLKENKFDEITRLTKDAIAAIENI